MLKCVRDALGVPETFAKMLTTDESDESLPVFQDVK
jgi:hypothetical protein